MIAIFKPYSVRLHEPQLVCKLNDNPDMVSHIKMVLSRNVKQLMSNSPKYNSNAKLAKAAGLGLGTINRIITGESSASIDTVEAVAEKFNLTPSQILSENLFASDNSAPPATASRINYESPLSDLMAAAETAYQRGSLNPQALANLIGLLDSMNPAPPQNVDADANPTRKMAALEKLGTPPPMGDTIKKH